MTLKDKHCLSLCLLSRHSHESYILHIVIPEKNMGELLANNVVAFLFVFPLQSLEHCKPVTNSHAILQRGLYYFYLNSTAIVADLHSMLQPGVWLK